MSLEGMSYHPRLPTEPEGAQSSIPPFPSIKFQYLYLDENQANIQIITTGEIRSRTKHPTRSDLFV